MYFYDIYTWGAGRKPGFLIYMTVFRNSLINRLLGKAPCAWTLRQACAALRPAVLRIAPQTNHRQGRAASTGHSKACIQQASTGRSPGQAFPGGSQNRPRGPQTQTELAPTLRAACANLARKFRAECAKYSRDFAPSRNGAKPGGSAERRNPRARPGNAAEAGSARVLPLFCCARPGGAVTWLTTVHTQWQRGSTHAGNQFF